MIIQLRKELSKQGLDAGAETIAAHLTSVRVDTVPATSTIWRIVSRRVFVDPQPQKRPRSSWHTFCADGSAGFAPPIPGPTVQTCGKVERFQQTQKKWLAGRNGGRAATPARPI
jgi:hypothetical protein